MDAPVIGEIPRLTASKINKGALVGAVARVTTRIIESDTASQPAPAPASPVHETLADRVRRMKPPAAPQSDDPDGPDPDGGTPAPAPRTSSGFRPRPPAAPQTYAKPQRVAESTRPLENRPTPRPYAGKAPLSGAALAAAALGRRKPR